MHVEVHGAGQRVLVLEARDRVTGLAVAAFERAIVPGMLEPLERLPLWAVAAAPMVHAVNTQCPREAARFSGARLRDCTFKLGWYRLVPRQGR